MKQDLAERLAHGELHCIGVVAPDLDLLARPAPVRLATRPANDAERARLMGLRDEYVQLSSRGRYVDAAAREWRQLPISWRMSMLMMGGVGQDVDSLGTLALRDWHEMPPHEQAEVRGVVRGAKKHLLRLTALAARV
ncbi:hypothetical protein B2J88_11855 [Rhodococcus sp. SRB_17]|uniref:hypothetical protein n=1 Tax=Acidovorax sp. SRB_24 TaxID=1962700 RepID=UPI00145CBEA8|nr:hypothetical protein [Acidovorax sp. SRB_24]NMM75535.1 hypothetical protein [Acidovorax sp. SRB_24]NMM85054.1 hypothetical protein [Rhodococcus sp. SRB_17]